MQLTAIEHGEMPFYAWECLQIELPHRNIDLMVPNENDMLTLLSLLIWKTETINGIAGTAVPLTKLMNMEKQQQLYSAVLMKYKVMKIRMKISFIALQKRITIKELFYK